MKFENSKSKLSEPYSFPISCNNNPSFISINNTCQDVSFLKQKKSCFTHNKVESEIENLSTTRSCPTGFASQELKRCSIKELLNLRRITFEYLKYRSSKTRNVQFIHLIKRINKELSERDCYDDNDFSLYDYSRIDEFSEYINVNNERICINGSYKLIKKANSEKNNEIDENNNLNLNSDNDSSTLESKNKSNDRFSYKLKNKNLSYIINTKFFTIQPKKPITIPDFLNDSFPSQSKNKYVCFDKLCYTKSSKQSCMTNNYSVKDNHQNEDNIFSATRNCHNEKPSNSCDASDNKNYSKHSLSNVNSNNDIYADNNSHFSCEYENYNTHETKHNYYMAFSSASPIIQEDKYNSVKVSEIDLMMKNTFTSLEKKNNPFIDEDDKDPFVVSIKSTNNSNSNVNSDCNSYCKNNSENSHNTECLTAPTTNSVTPILKTLKYKVEIKMNSSMKSISGISNNETNSSNISDIISTVSADNHNNFNRYSNIEHANENDCNNLTNDNLSTMNNDRDEFEEISTNNIIDIKEEIENLKQKIITN